ncbi:MAG: thymidine kinase [Alphaproteobacteria bacterium]|nr:thymidine kinase [Alphaproteobacteria bacterium]
MAKLHFYYGVMGSSKSAQLIINAFNYRKSGKNVEVIKPAIDTRFDVNKVTSRAGDLSVDALALKNLDNYQPKPETNVVFVDELQFFSPADVDKLAHFADIQDKIVICYGLMVDSNEKLFPASQHMIEIGAELHTMESNCQIDGCLHRATHHLRFDGAGNVIRAGEQVVLGDSNYKSVCRMHYNQMYKQQKQN